MPQGSIPSLDLFSLSRIFERSGSQELSLATCRKALEAGLPEHVETQALWQLAAQHKRRREHQLAIDLWLEVARRDTPLALCALEELAIYYEHRARDAAKALGYAERALSCVRSPKVKGESGANFSAGEVERVTHRLARLRRKAEQAKLAVDG